MLRNSLQIALCGLIVLNVTACTSVSPLIVRSSEDAKLCNLHIKADPYVEYIFTGELRRILPQYMTDSNKYVITIEISENTSSAIYTQKEVAKEQIRMTSHIEVYDSFYNHLGSKQIDAYSTYDVCDEMPHSIITAKKHARDTATQELAQASVLAVKAIIIDSKK